MGWSGRSKRGWEGMSGGRGGELKTWRFQFLHKYWKPRISKRFRRHVRNYLNPCAVNDSIKTRQTRLIRGPLRGSILQLFIIIIIIWMIMYLHPHSLILVTLTPHPSFQPSSSVLIHPTSYAFRDWARRMLESCQLKCQDIIVPLFCHPILPLASITRDIWSWITRPGNCNVFV